MGSGGGIGTVIVRLPDAISDANGGGGSVKQIGNVINVDDVYNLAIALHCINGPESGTTTITIQDSPNYVNDDLPAHWFDLVTFGTLDVDDADTWFREQVPDGTIYTFFNALRVVAINSESGQTCRFDVTIDGY